eukprot:CCRYP_019460-RA/>CCRYP_019460-RA protein AED:0.08 eAED:0.08 QI:0/-1/0/1/-1/1/1/0/597
MRYDIAFFLCCCRSFLSSSDENESYYDLLGVPPTATPEELKRAYKRQSLLMHPDKLAQKGQTVTAADRDRFTRMRNAYEVLSDPRRRETYDAIGERGMKWVEEPLSVDPQELAHNFATSSVYDRSKIFAIFLAVYVAVFLLPILVCLMADGELGPGARWTVVLIPLWLWDVIILFYHSRVILMGPIKRPDHIPEEEWVDPLPMWKRVLAICRFALLVLFEVLLALQLDGFIRAPWWLIFLPIFLWEFIALRKKILLANMSVVTHEELELAIGKKFTECSPAEKEDIHRRFIVVPTNEGSIYEAACRLRSEATGDIIRILARIIFSVLLVLNLELQLDWSWWLVFLPIWCMAFCIVGAAFRRFSEAQAEAAQRDPETFGNAEQEAANGWAPSTSYAKMDESKKDGQPQPLSDEERDELKAKVMHSAYRAVGTCFSQCFFLFLMCLLIAKIEGAGYSSVLIISPFLIFGGVLLCCLACTIFCITEVDENAGMADFDSNVNQAAAAAGYGTTDYDTNNSYQPPNQQPQQQDTQGSASSYSNDCRTPVESTWDPEYGQVWTSEKRDEPSSTPVEMETLEQIPLDDVKDVEKPTENPSFDLD